MNRRQTRPYVSYQMRHGDMQSQAPWERDVRKQAFKGFRWLILGPVLGVFAAVAVLLVFK
jgi:hypothetical protein